MQVEPRYSRNIEALTVAQLAELHTKKVCVIGCGGLGGYIVEILARIGVLHITVVDNDVFDHNNLNRQLFSKEALLGYPKVQAAQERISEVNSQVTLTPLQTMLTDENAATILAGHDVVVDALDNIKTRFMLAKHCDLLGIPMVHGAIGGWYGQVCTVFPGDDSLSKLYRNQDHEKGVEVGLGNLPFTASTVASLQCAEAVKVLVNKGAVVRHAALQVDLLYGDIHKLQLA